MGELQEGIRTSQLLATARSLDAELTEATFWKWRQEDLIPDPLPVRRRGLGRGLGRDEALWPPGTVERLLEIYGFRLRGLRFDEIAVELWLSEREISWQRVRAGLTRECERFWRKLGTLLDAIEFGPPGAAGFRPATIRRLAKKFARKAHPSFQRLPRQDREAAEQAWRSLLRIALPRSSQHWEHPTDQSLLSGLGFPEPVDAFLRQDPRRGQELRDLLRGTFDAEAINRILREASEDTLKKAGRLTRGLGLLVDLLREAPVVLHALSPDWSAVITVLMSAYPVLPRTIWLGFVVWLLHKLKVSDEVMGSFDQLEEIQRQLQETRQRLLGQVAGTLGAASA